MRNRIYLVITVLFIVFGLYFTSWFTIAIENRSGQTLETIEFRNKFKNATYRQIPADSIIVIKAFIPFNRKIYIRSKTAGSIQNYMFTAENAYAGAKYNTVIIEEGISRAYP